MAKKSPIVILEDDDEDRSLFQEIFTQLGFENQLRFFSEASEALSYLEKTNEKTFLILSDMSLLGMTGIEVKKAINDNETLRKKAIPFIFYTSSSDKYTVSKAYFDMMVQGYFETVAK
ncbi:MAG: response regulator [Chitinophagaceae bacterium]